MKWLILVLVAACGDDGGGGTLSEGSYRLVGETVNGTATPAAELNGALEVTTTEYGLGIARPAPTGVVASYTVSGGSIVLGGGTNVAFTADGDRLTLRPDADHTWTLERFTPTAAEMFPVTGTVEMARGAEAMMSPHAAIIHYNRGQEGTFLLEHDPRDDKPLSFEGGVASFDLSRTRPALGTDRIPMGATAGISIAIVVVYDDRDGGGLGVPFMPCATPGGDCIRGMSTILLASRDGTSAELSGSPYALLREGWSNAVQVTDKRSGRLGLTSADEKALTHQITVVVDPAQVVPPGFQL
jgi:hypothetical protein